MAESTVNTPKTKARPIRNSYGPGSVFAHKQEVKPAMALQLLSNPREGPDDAETLDAYSRVVTSAVERVAASVIKIDVQFPAQPNPNPRRGPRPERSGSGSGFIFTPRCFAPRNTHARCAASNAMC